jgi:hypothetical protein
VASYDFKLKQQTEDHSNFNAYIDGLFNTSKCKLDDSTLPLCHFPLSWAQMCVRPIRFTSERGNPSVSVDIKVRSERNITVRRDNAFITGEQNFKLDNDSY